MKRTSGSFNWSTVWLGMLMNVGKYCGHLRTTALVSNTFPGAIKILEITFINPKWLGVQGT